MSRRALKTMAKTKDRPDDSPLTKKLALGNSIYDIFKVVYIL